MSAEHVERMRLRYRPDDLFELVSDVRRYPDFIKPITAMRITQDDVRDGVGELVAEARARVQRHVLEGTRPDDSDDTDEEFRRPAPAKPSGGRKKGKKGRRKK